MGNAIQTAVVKVVGILDPSVAKTVADANKKFSGLKAGVAVAGAAIAGATTAAVAFGKSALDAAATFETGMSNIATLLDGDTATVNKRIAEMGDDIMGVAKKTGVATDDLSNGMYQIVSALGDSKDATSQLEVAAKAAKAGGATTVDAINLLSAVTKGYGDTSGEAWSKASDLAFQTVKLGQTSFPELAASMGKVVPIASALNISQEELFGSFATLTGVTGSTAEVSTQLKSVFSGLMTPSTALSEKIGELGYESANAMLDQLGLIGTLDKLSAACGDDKQAVAKLFSSVEAQTAVLALAGSQTENWVQKTEAMAGAANATSNAFDKQTDNLQGKLAKMKQVFETFKIKVGNILIPIVTDFVDKAIPKIEKVFDTIFPILKKVYSAAKPVIDGISTAIEAVMPIIGEIASFIMSSMESITPVTKSIVKSVGKIIKSVQPLIKTVFKSVGGIIKAISPVLQRVGNLIANVVEKIAPLVQVVTDTVTSILEAVMPVIDGVIAGIMPLIDAAVNSVGKILDAVIPVINGIVKQVTPIITKIMDAISPLIDMLMETVIPIINVVLEAVVNVIGDLMPVIETAANAIIPIIEYFVNKIILKVNLITDVFKNVIGFVKNVFTGNWQGALENLKNIATAPIKYISGLFENIITVVDRIIAVVKEKFPVFGAVIQSFRDSLQPVIDGIKGVFSGLIDFIQNVFTGNWSAAWESVKSIFGNAFNALKGLFATFSNIFSGISGAVSNMVASIGERFPILGAIIQTVQGMVAPYIDGIKNAISSIKNVFTGLIDFVKNVFTGNWAGAWESVKSIFGNAFNALKGLFATFSNIFSGISGAVSNMVASISERFPVLGTIFQTVQGMVAPYIDGIKNAISSIKNVFTSLIDFVKNVFTGNWAGAWESVKNIFGNAFSALKGLVKAPLNAVISLINSAIGGLNKLHISIPDWVPGLGGKEFGINIPKIPMLATGGIATQPSICGEGGYPEYVISTDPKYREQNQQTVLEAAKSIGALKEAGNEGNTVRNALKGFNGGSVSNTVNNNREATAYRIEFSPVINISGNTNNARSIADEVMRVFDDYQGELADKIKAVLATAREGSYGI